MSMTADQIISGEVVVYQGKTYHVDTVFRAANVEDEQEVKRLLYFVISRHPGIVVKSVGAGRTQVNFRDTTTIVDNQKADPGQVITSTGLKILGIYRIEQKRVGTYWAMGPAHLPFGLVHALEPKDLDHVTLSDSEERSTHESLMADLSDEVPATERKPAPVAPERPTYREGGGFSWRGVDLEVLPGGRPSRVSVVAEFPSDLDPEDPEAPDGTDDWTKYALDTDGNPVAFERTPGNWYAPVLEEDD